MYRFEITEEIASDLARIESLRERLDLQGPMPRRWLGRLRRELEAESVAASTAMEGVAVTVEEVRRLLAGDIPGAVTERDAALVRGYRDAMSYVMRRADDDAFAWHSEFLLAIHDRVMGGSFADEAGRLRTRPVWVSDAASGEVRYEAPPAASTLSLIESSAAWLASATDIPAPVLAALAHIRIAGIHPFRDGNGRTARIVAAFVMHRAGLRAPEFTSLEEWWGAHRGEYYAAFACLGDTWDDTRDVTPFVAAHVAAQRSQADALSLRLATQSELWAGVESYVEAIGSDLRAANAVWEAFFGRPVTNLYYRGLTDVSPVTAAADLGRLTAGGALTLAGAGRGSRYLPTEALFAGIARTLDLPCATALVGDGEEARATVVGAIAQRIRARDELIAREAIARYESAVAR